MCDTQGSLCKWQESVFLFFSPFLKHAQSHLSVDSSQIRLLPNKWRICSGHSFIVASEEDSAKLHNVRLIGRNCSSGFILLPSCQVPRGSVFNLPDRKVGGLRKARKSAEIKQLRAAFKEISAETVWSELDYRSSVKNNHQTQ